MLVFRPAMISSCPSGADNSAIISIDRGGGVFETTTLRFSSWETESLISSTRLPSSTTNSTWDGPVPPSLITIAGLPTIAATIAPASSVFPVALAPTTQLTTPGVKRYSASKNGPKFLIVTFEKFINPILMRPSQYATDEYNPAGLDNIPRQLSIRLSKHKPPRMGGARILSGRGYGVIALHFKHYIPDALVRTYGCGNRLIEGKVCCAFRIELTEALPGFTTRSRIHCSTFEKF